MIVDNSIPIPVKSFYSMYIKRLLDFFLSLFALIVFSPVFIIIIIICLCIQGRPIFYCMERPGKDEKLFNIYKFRTMTNEKNKHGDLLPAKDRITKFGKILRRYSLDELPELWSILKGDMAIVGPRPLLKEYIPLYSPRHLMRHCIRPGLACERIDKKNLQEKWTWGIQFETDIYYIEHISFITDIKTLFAVAKEALSGSEYRTNATRSKFTGDNLFM